MRLLLRKKFLNIFIPTFIVLFVLIGGLTYYVYLRQKERILTNTVNRYTYILKQQGELINALFTPTISVLNLLARQRSVVDYLKTPVNKKLLVDDMQLFALSNRNYKQVRFIDTNGMEKIRINWIKDSVVIVPDSQLQNKSYRSYFIKSKKLKPGEIYISSIDLNVEHRKIEVPFQRVIRFATPIYDLKRHLTGIIIITQYLNGFLLNLQKNYGNNNSDLMLLNSDG